MQNQASPVTLWQASFARMEVSLIVRSLTEEEERSIARSEEGKVWRKRIWFRNKSGIDTEESSKRLLSINQSRPIWHSGHFFPSSDRGKVFSADVASHLYFLQNAFQFFFSMVNLL